MQLRFDLILNPSESDVRDLAEREPENIYLSTAFLRGYALRGFTPCLLGLWNGDQPAHVCIGAFKKGRLSSSLDIRLLPELPQDSPFWPGLLAACKRLNVWDLSLYAVTTSPDPIPNLGPLTFSESGEEYHIDLGSEPVPLPPNTNLRRNIAKAQKNGVVFHRTSSPSAIAPHLALMESSMDRRKERGEEVSGSAQGRYFEIMLKAGAGEFFQAHDATGKALSSIFFLRSKASAYYQSAGTSPEGMSLGASPFVVWNTAETLRKEGVTRFRLGGSTLVNTGLVRFKTGFGSVAVPFHSRVFCLASPLKRKLRTLLGLARSNPRDLLATICHLDRYPVFAQDLASMPQPEPRPELALVKLDDATLRALCLAQPDFHRQAERLDEFPFNDAWGLMIGDALAHVSWLVTPEHDRLCGERNIKLREGEVEITHCYTSPTHRGKGLYPYAIRALSQEALKQGYKRVLMITHHTNTASIQGITKAGLMPLGSVRQLRSSMLSESPLMTFRGHR